MDISTSKSVSARRGVKELHPVHAPLVPVPFQFYLAAMSATPLPAIVALIISAYILSATFGRSAADGPLAESSPKSDRSTMGESKNTGGGSLTDADGDWVPWTMAWCTPSLPREQGW